MMTWQERVDSWPESTTKVIQKGFGGIPAGSTILIPCPAEVRAYIDALQPGEFRTAQQLSSDLAEAHQVAGTCPVTRGLCLRIVSELALEGLANGQTLSEITPFWRVVEPKSTLAPKLTCGPKWVAERRQAELN